MASPLPTEEQDLGDYAQFLPQSSTPNLAVATAPDEDLGDYAQFLPASSTPNLAVGSEPDEDLGDYAQFLPKSPAPETEKAVKESVLKFIEPAKPGMGQYASAGELESGLRSPLPSPVLTEEQKQGAPPLVPSNVATAAIRANPALLPFEQLKRVLSEQNPVRQVYEGAVLGAGDVASGLTTPANLALLPLGFAGRAANVVLAGGFAVQAAQHLPEQWKQYNETDDPSEKTRLLVNMAAGLGLPLAALGGSLRGTKFKTEKGSEYLYSEGETLSREKPDTEWHGPDKALKETPSRTVFLEPDNAAGVSEFMGAPVEGGGLSKSTVVGPEGLRLTVSDRNGAVIESETVPFVSSPREGLHPFEVWGDGTEHVGNRIVEVSAKPEAPTPRGEAAVQGQARLDVIKPRVVELSKQIEELSGKVETVDDPALMNLWAERESLMNEGYGIVKALTVPKASQAPVESVSTPKAEVVEPVGITGALAEIQRRNAPKVTRIDDVTGLPLNDDGTVTLYHGTTKEGAATITESGQLKATAEQAVYLTTAPDGTGYGDGTVVKVRVKPSQLRIDDEFPNGRKDFAIDTGKSKAVSVAIEEAPPEQGKGPVASVSTPQAKPGVSTTATSEPASTSLTGAPEAFGGMAKGMTESFYTQAFDSLQQGKSTIAGVKDPILTKAKPHFDRGTIKSPQDLRDWAQAGQPDVFGGGPTAAGQSPRPANPPKPSKIGQSIEAKAVEAKLTTGFAETAGYDPITIKDQAQRATGLVKSSLPDARAIIRGDKPLPPELRGTSLITAMEEHLVNKPDAELAYELANSPLTSATSVAAQEMRLMSERVPDSITAKFREIREARQEGSKQRGETTEKVVKEIRREVVKNSSKRPTWEAFVREITCA